jgi:hypothetical protein
MTPVLRSLVMIFLLSSIVKSIPKDSPFNTCLSVFEFNESMSKRGYSGQFMKENMPGTWKASGNFGTIYKATFKKIDSEEVLELAVKTSFDKNEYLDNEIEVYTRLSKKKDLKHIPEYFGCVLHKDNIYVIMEYWGAVLKFRKMKKKTQVY